MGGESERRKVIILPASIADKPVAVDAKGNFVTLRDAAEIWKRRKEGERRPQPGKAL